MNEVSSPWLDADILRWLSQRLTEVGAVANEPEHLFDATSPVTVAENALKEAGFHGGTLAIESLVRPRNEVDAIIFDTSRFPSSATAEQAWEKDYRKRWHDRVQRRVEDWLERLQNLRAQIEAWLKQPDLGQLVIVDRAPETMNEELMQRFDVSPQKMSVYEIKSGTQRVLRVQPKGLWIVGANGRVDLITKKSAPILVDQSEPLSGASNWQIYNSKERKSAVPLNKQTFSELVRAGL
jgi:hypothetical protein